MEVPPIDIALVAALVADQFPKEQRWLPFLASQLPLSVPAPMGEGITGPENFFRGGPLLTYDEETRRAIDTLAAVTDFGSSAVGDPACDLSIA